MKRLFSAPLHRQEHDVPHPGPPGTGDEVGEVVYELRRAQQKHAVAAGQGRALAGGVGEVERHGLRVGVGG